LRAAVFKPAGCVQAEAAKGRKGFSRQDGGAVAAINSFIRSVVKTIARMRLLALSSPGQSAYRGRQLGV